MLEILICNIEFFQGVWTEYNLVQKNWKGQTALISLDL